MRKSVARRPGGSATGVLRTGALFCGIGGFCSGFEAAGFKSACPRPSQTDRNRVLEASGISKVIQISRRGFQQAAIRSDWKCRRAPSSDPAGSRSERKNSQGGKVMSATVGWEFPIDGGDQWQGFNDPGIEHFRGNPFGSLARELIQNSLDAASGSPVIVSFELKEIASADIPNISQLRNAVQRCATAEGNEGKKAKDFFTTAQKLLAAKKLPVLTITETNTTGIPSCGLEFSCLNLVASHIGL